MKTQILRNAELPTFLPHGWKKEVAEALDVRPNTIKNALQSGRGATYNRIVKTATEKYGK